MLELIILFVVSAAVLLAYCVKRIVYRLKLLLIDQRWLLLDEPPKAIVFMDQAGASNDKRLELAIDLVNDELKKPLRQLWREAEEASQRRYKNRAGTTI